jgi:hypothetical protein
MYRIIWTAASLATMVVGQTQVDLRTQSKSVDFSAASSTKPVTTGTSLPATCGVGQMFFLSSAPAGQNVYGCATANNWTMQSGSGGAGGVNVESAGTLVGSNSTLDFSGGAGIVYAISNIGSAISIQTAANTAVIPTLASDQAGGVRFCASSSGSVTSYTCAMSPTLTLYTAGMVLDWKPDVTASGGGATLNVDFLGARSIKLPDGVTDPAPGDIVAGRMQQIWYDGTGFRILSEVIPAGVLGDALPACGTLVRGRLWYIAGAPGVKDTVLVCAKDATNTFSWRTLY